MKATPPGIKLILTWRNFHNFSMAYSISCKLWLSEIEYIGLLLSYWKKKKNSIPVSIPIKYK